MERLMKLDNIKNFGQLFIQAIENYGKREVLKWKRTGISAIESENYQSLDGERLKELVYHASMSIEQLKRFDKSNLYSSNDKAAIISENRYEWVVSDFACIFNKIVTVPIYTTMTTAQIKYILEHSESRLCFVSNKLILEKIISISKKLPNLKRIICFNKVERVPDYVLSFEDFISPKVRQPKELRLRTTEEHADDYFKKKSEQMREDDLLTIIYTSGTTGIPKGVCLAHKNLLSNIKSCHQAFQIDHNDTFLSFLPLAHSYERTAGYYFPFAVGAKISYAQSIDTLNKQFAEVRPTIVTAVPILFNKMHRRLIKNSETLPFLRKKIFNFALSNAKKYRNNKKHILWKLSDKLVFKKIKNRLGGNIRFFISGGSALNKEVAETFDSFGITILEGYGMTEASPVIAVNRLDKNKFGTVGIPLEGVNVKIAKDGEIIVNGDNVMKGYYKDKAETDKTVIDGWLNTGDIGEFDDDGRLKITDRKKTLFKTSGGKYISLTHIEETISRSNYVEQIIAFGGDRMFVSALIVPEFEEMNDFAKVNDILAMNNEELIKNPYIVGLIESEINKYQSNLAKYERVRKFTLLSRPFSIEKGELTPTMKIKRKVIEEMYRQEIEKMYEISK